jgi:hypothetical protein
MTQEFTNPESFDNDDLFSQFRHLGLGAPQGLVSEGPESAIEPRIKRRKIDQQTSISDELYSRFWSTLLGLEVDPGTINIDWVAEYNLPNHHVDFCSHSTEKALLA